jgi:glycosyltransferase involved in cell wall biosynthesis
MAQAIAQAWGAENVAVITTDAPGGMPPGKLPAGVRHIDFATPTQGFTAPVRQRLLFEFLRALGGQVLFNVNSRLMWDAWGPHGRTLAGEMRLYAVLFCDDQDLFGHWDGYPARYFYRHFDTLAGVCTDSHALARDLARRFALPEADRTRLHVLEGPVDPALPLVAAPAPGGDDRPARIFWAGRFDPQKRVDVVYALAAAMPEAEFHMWGEAVQPAGAPLPPRPPNVIHHGVYRNLADLPLQDCDLWLYTSAWDGVPGMLLEVAMTGIPIVGSDVGGTAEVLREGLAWPVAPCDDVAAFRAAIAEVLANPAAARVRAGQLRETLAAERSAARFAASISALLPDREPAG